MKETSSDPEDVAASTVALSTMHCQLKWPAEVSNCVTLDAWHNSRIVFVALGISLLALR